MTHYRTTTERERRRETIKDLSLAISLGLIFAWLLFEGLSK
jgi:hypothetical protein